MRMASNHGAQKGVALAIEVGAVVRNWHARPIVVGVNALDARTWTKRILLIWRHSTVTAALPNGVVITKGDGIQQLIRGVLVELANLGESVISEAEILTDAEAVSSMRLMSIDSADLFSGPKGCQHANSVRWSRWSCLGAAGNANNQHRREPILNFGR